LFIYFFKTNTFGRAYLHGAAKSRCRAMHGGVVGAVTWQRPGPLNADVDGATARTDLGVALTRHGVWRGKTLAGGFTELAGPSPG